MKTCLVFALFGVSLWAQFTPQATAPKSDANPEIAVVDGQTILLSDIRKMIESAPPQILQQFKVNPQMAIQTYFVIKHLAAEGDKAKLAEESPLKEQLEMLRANIVAEAMLNQERDGYKVSEEMIKNFYERNKSRYEQAKVKIIYLASRPAPAPCKTPEECAKQAVEAAHPASVRSEEEARKLADDILAKLKAGAKFEEMVAKYSDDEESKKTGGDLGKAITSTSSYSDDVKKAIFALKVGEVSSPFRQSTGFLLIRLEEKTTQPLNEVIEPIVQEIRQTHLNDYINSLNRRFQPAVKDTDFFLKPETFLAPQAK
jgi:parvulin-like peptidyl-prolyl isomerase